MAQREQAFHLFPEVEKTLGYSQAIMAGQTLYLSGMISVDETLRVIGPGDMRKQVETVYAILGRVLEQHGMSLKNVVKEVAYVTDIQAMADGRSARIEAYERAGAYPAASTMVEVRALFSPDAMIEVDMIAVK